MRERCSACLKESGRAMRILDVQIARERFEYSGGGSSGGMCATRDLHFPEDLREWVSEAELAHLIDDVVGRVRDESGSGGRTRAWDVMLAILAYFYSSGLYVSEEIENALHKNPDFAAVQAMAFGNAPVSAVLRSFRRKNRGAIEECLADIFRSALLRTGEASDAYGERLIDYQREAKVRVAHAIQADSWAMDV